MKILFVTDLYPIKDEKAAKALKYFIIEWKRQGHNVEVIKSNFIINTLVRGRKIYPENIYFEDGIKIYNLNFQTPFLFNVYKKLPKDFSLQNYDVIISHMPCGALMAQKLLTRDKIKYVCAVHASDITVLKDYKYALYFGKRLKKAYKSADKIAARSPVLKRKIEEIIPCAQNKTFIAYSGIDEKYIKQNENPLNRKEIMITTACQLIKRKNTDIIIKSLAKLNDKNIKLTIIGGGKEKNKLEKLAEKLKLKNQITFKGELTREDTIKEINKSEIFIMLSNNETFGLSYLEAAGAGNIIIAKKNDGIEGILKDNREAFFIEPSPNDLRDCINKIKNMKDEEIKELRSNLYNTISKYTLTNAAQNYLKNIFVL